MVKRKNLKITPETYSVLENYKRGMETWDSLLRRLADNYNAESKESIALMWVRRFLEAKATVEENAVMPKDDLYWAFQSYMYVMDDSIEIPKNTFGWAIQRIENYPIDTTQRRIEGKQTNVYTGIRLNDE